MKPAIKKHICLISGLGLTIILLLASAAFSGMECEGTQYGGVYYKRGQHYYPVIDGVKYDCVACGNCSPMSGSYGSSSAMPYGPGLSPSQKMASALVPLLIDAALSMPSDNDADIQQQQAAMQKAAQEAEQKEREERAEKWEQMNASAASKNQGGNLFGGTGGGGSGLTASGEPSAADLAPRIKAVSGSAESGGADASKKSQFQQLLCAAYFSRLAEEAANSGDEDRARYMGKQAEIVMAGGTPEIECRYPPVPDVPVPQGKEPADDTGVIAMVQQDIQGLRDTDVQLQAIAREKEQALAEKSRLKKEIAALETGASARKTKGDDPLPQKKKDLAETEKALASLETQRQKLINQQNEIKNRLTTVKDNIQAGLSNP